MKRKKIQDANTYIQNDTYLVKKKKKVYTYICEEKILKGNTAKCFWGYLRRYGNHGRIFCVSFTFPSFSKFPIPRVHYLYYYSKATFCKLVNDLPPATYSNFKKPSRNLWKAAAEVP